MYLECIMSLIFEYYIVKLFIVEFNLSKPFYYPDQKVRNIYYQYIIYY